MTTTEQPQHEEDRPDAAGPRARSARRAGPVRGRGPQGLGRGRLFLKTAAASAEQLCEVVNAAREAGATGVWTNLLFRRVQPVEPEQLALAV